MAHGIDHSIIWSRWCLPGFSTGKLLFLSLKLVGILGGDTLRPCKYLFYSLYFRSLILAWIHGSCLQQFFFFFQSPHSLYIRNSNSAIGKSFSLYFLIQLYIFYVLIIFIYGLSLNAIVIYFFLRLFHLGHGMHIQVKTYVLWHILIIFFSWHFLNF